MPKSRDEYQPKVLTLLSPAHHAMLTKDSAMAGYGITRTPTGSAWSRRNETRTSFVGFFYVRT
jgi:hypothetical protein